MKIIITILIFFLTQQFFLRAEWEKCNTPKSGSFNHIIKSGNYYFGATRNGIARSADSADTWGILNNQLKDKFVNLVLPVKNSIYFISDSKIYKSDDYGVTVQYITKTDFPNFRNNDFSHNEDTFFFIINYNLKYYVDDFTKLNYYFSPNDSIKSYAIFELKGDLIISTNKGYFRTQNYTNNLRKFDELDHFPYISYISYNDEEIYFATDKSIYKSEDKLVSYTKIFEQNPFSIQDIQANADGLFVVFYEGGIGFYNRINKVFEFEDKYKNVGFNNIATLDDNILFKNELYLLKTKKIGGEYKVCGYKDSFISKVRLNNNRLFGILSDRLMYSDDECLNWNIYDNDFLGLESFEIIDSIFFVSYDNPHTSESAILRSSNFGKDWKEININDKSQPFAKEFLYKDNSLYVAGEVGAYVSKDKGLSWLTMEKSIYEPQEFISIDSFLFVTSYFKIIRVNINDNYSIFNHGYPIHNEMNYIIQVNDDVIIYSDRSFQGGYYLSKDRGNSFKMVDTDINIPLHHLFNDKVRKDIINYTLHFSFDDGVSWINLFDEKEYEFYDFFILNNYVIANTSKGLFRKKLSEFKATSVNMNNQEVCVNISPNPASDYIEINLNNESSPIASEKVRIFDILGVEVMNIGTGLDLPTQRIDVSHLPAGVYFVRYGDRVEKFVKSQY